MVVAMISAKKAGEEWMMRRAIAMIMAVLLVLSWPGLSLARPRDREKGRPGQRSMVGPPGLTRRAMPFDDMDESPWATGYVARAKARGLVQGVGRGKFSPRAAVRQAEAVAMAIRALHLEDEAEKIKEVPKLPGIQAVRWASGYLALAAREGLIDLRDVRPNASSSRLWATVLLAKAAGLKPSDQPVPFTDVHQIPRAFLGYVAAALEAGLISGYEDGSFKPNRSLSRAEMAALIERLAGRAPGATIKGTITGMGATFIEVDGKEHPVGDEVVVTIDGDHEAYQDLEVGYVVQVVLDAQGKVASITAVSEREVEGTIAALANGQIQIRLDDDDEDEVLALPVAPDATITIDDAAGTWDQLQVGDEVKVTIKAGVVTEIEAESTVKHTAGIITAVDTTEPFHLELVSALGKDRTLPVAPTVEVKHNDQTIPFAQLLPGDIVRLTISRELVVAVRVLARLTLVDQTTVTGRITALGQGTVTVDEGYPLPLAEQAVIKLDGKTVTLADLRVGDQATLTVRARSVQRVEAQAQVVERLGVVRELAQNDGVWSLSLLTAAGNQPSRLEVSESATISYQGATVNLDAIAIEDAVIVSVRRGQITAIRIIDRTLVTGKLMYINFKTGRLTIEIETGTEIGGALVTGAVLMYRDTVLTIEGLSAGDMVTARLSGGKVYSLRVTAKAR
jgi:hypothetical protein